MKPEHRSTAARQHLQQAQLIRNGNGVGMPTEKPHEPANRKERRAQAALARKGAPEKTEHKARLSLVDLVQADGRELAAWQAYDLNWFSEHPECSYHLRELFPGEYEPEEIPALHAWLSLVKIRRSDDGQGLPVIEHFPLAPHPVDGLNRLMVAQTMVRGQEALRDIWNDGREHHAQGVNNEH